MSNPLEANSLVHSSCVRSRPPSVTVSMSMSTALLMSSTAAGSSTLSITHSRLPDDIGSRTLPRMTPASSSPQSCMIACMT